MDLFGKYYTLSLRYLTRRPRSEKELTDYLLKKKLDATIIQQIIVRLKEQKFLDDKTFTQWWIDQRTRVNAKGMRVIQLELRKKGIPESDIEEVKSNPDVIIPSDGETARKLVAKKIAKYKGMDRHVIYQKLGSFLARRGFDWDTIRTAIDEHIRERV